MTWLSKLVTPGFIAFQAHCWFAYAVVFTFWHPWVIVAVVVAAAVKEFYVDKHFETGQTFDDNLQDFWGYCTGIALAWVAHLCLPLTC
jgi:hypothetical protein